MAPAPPATPTRIPGYEDIEGPLAKINTCGMATPPVGKLAASEEVPLHEALVLFDCSLDGVGVSQDASSRSSVPEDTGGTSAATPNCDFSSLSLPEEMLTPDYCIPELSNIMLSLEIFNVIGIEPRELWEDARMDLPPFPPAMADKKRKRQAQSSLPMAPSKRRALAPTAEGRMLERQP
ncbi:proline-rich protein 22-like [Accipiter gentilis]|uniref:proline-rich protein 22-like n=1 Tax=Astur gentilis TaxID=8957 RepID=UPI00210F27B7|nr:proline-rich protein 22-like [Accipiter gentilis]